MQHRSDGEELKERVAEVERETETLRVALLWIMDNVALDTSPFLLDAARNALRR